MADDINIEYEKLAQEIYQAINDQHELPNVEVQHNVRILGKSGCKHQIDVYWEFSLMGELHRVAIECKNYNSDVSIGKVRDFFAVLHDIGNIKGIFVTKKSYQKGAKEFADYYGISLKEMRYPNEADWEGRAKTIVFNSRCIMNRVKDREIFIDSDWAKQSGYDNTLPLSGMSDEVFINDLKAGSRKSMRHLEGHLPNDKVKETNRVHAVKYEDAYIETKLSEPVKIAGIRYTYDVSVAKDQFVIEGAEIAKAILKDVKTGKQHFYNTAGDIHDVG
ncbi:restriction endonuclease [Vibrio rotiferianus]|uniref:restriction endonuclease n=1 Tax=Vibrio rotiferianus TaxID=190895 RepID=UPI000693D98A|nr:restriction endonuclease [Vibrio rotiferianus]